MTVLSLNVFVVKFTISFMGLNILGNIFYPFFFFEKKGNNQLKSSFLIKRFQKIQIETKIERNSRASLTPIKLYIRFYVFDYKLGRHRRVVISLCQIHKTVGKAGSERETESGGSILPANCRTHLEAVESRSFYLL